MTKHDDKVYLGHILDSIGKIERYVADVTIDQFQYDEKTIDAVIRNFEIIGEASNNISTDFKYSYPEMNLRPVVSFRNRLIHGYDDIDLETVWNTIKRDLPELASEIKRIL